MSDDSKPPNEFCALEITYRVECHDMDPDIQFVLLSAYAKLQGKHTDALKMLEEMAGALKYYGGIDYGSDAYSEVFDCITRESDSVTNFDSDKFSLKAREALESYRKFKGE